MRLQNGALTLSCFSLIILTMACKSNSENTGATQSRDVASVLKRADELYAGRSDLGRVREAITLLRNTEAAQEKSYDIAWRLAQFNFYLSENSEVASERENALADGINAGRAATALQPEKAEGHFWLGANLGRKAETGGVLAGVSTVSEIRREMEAVVKFNDRYMGGSAYLALGQLDLQVPAFLGGDRARAVQYLEKGVKVDDDNPRMQVMLAKAYLAAGRKEDARRVAKGVLKMTPDPNYVPEFNKAVSEARSLLEKL
jgi:tetratricopeptide (TPR) repeat protein